MLVAPGAPFATQVWGNTHDEPLQVLGDSPWGVRDSIPLTPPQTIRALDSVQRLFAAGRPRPASPTPLPARASPMWWCATTWTPKRPGQPARCWSPGGRRLPGAEKVAQFGDPVGRHAGGIHRRQRTAAAVPGC